MPTYDAFLKAAQSSSFVGRRELLNTFRDRLDGTSSAGHVLNVYGQTGMGKSFLLLRFSAIAEALDIPVIGLNAQRASTPWLILQGIRLQLENVNYRDGHVREFDRVIDRLNSIEARYYKAQEAIVADSDSDDAATIGGMLGEIAGMSTGMPFLSILGSGIGSLVGARLGRADLQQIFPGMELREEEIRLCLTAGTILTREGIAAVNGLAKRRGSCVLTVDVFEQATPTVDEWLRVELLPQLDTTVVIAIAGRVALKRLKAWAELYPIILPMEVVPFTEEETIEFWEANGLRDANRAKVIQNITSGYPFLNGLLADMRRKATSENDLNLSELVNLRGSSQLIDQIFEQFMTELKNERFRQVIRACAVPRWFDSSLLESAAGREAGEIFDQVTTLSFVLQNREGSFSLHELAREVILSEAMARDPEWVRAVHTRVADELSARRTESGAVRPDYIGDEIYHRLSANEAMGLDFAEQMFGSLKSIGPIAALDPLISELATFPFQTHRGKLWRTFCEVQDALYRGQWDIAERSVDELLLQPDLPTDLRTWSLETKATVLVGRGRYREALTLQEGIVNQLSTEDESASRWDAVEAYYRLIETCGILSKFEEGESYISRSLDRFGSEPLSRARLLLAAATVHRLHGFTDRGLTAAAEAVAIYRSDNDPRLTAFALIQLARLTTHQGLWREAESQLNEALELEMVAPYEYDMGNIYLFLGNVYRRRMHWSKSLEFYGHALEIHQRMNSLREIGPLYGSLGLVHHALGDRALSRRYMRESLQLKESQEYERGVGFTLKYMGDLALGERELPAARDLYIRSIDIADRLDIGYLGVWSRLGLARANLLSGRYVDCHIVLADSSFNREDYGDIRCGVSLYRAVASLVSKEGASEHRGAGVDDLAVGLRYNPYCVYDLLDMLSADIGFLIQIGAVRKSVREILARSMESTFSRLALMGVENASREREEIGQESKTFMEQIREWR